MAESILYNVAANIITKLGSTALRDLGLLWRVDDELDELQDTLSTIKDVILDAEKQSELRGVKNWVSELKDACHDLEDLIDEFSYEIFERQVMTRVGRSTYEEVCNSFSKLQYRLEVVSKIKKIREKLKAINDRKNQFSFLGQHVAVIDTTHDWLRKRRETHSFILEEEVIGRTDDKKAIIDLLLNTNTNTNTKEDIAVISIVGMGGLGKTALAQSVYNDNMMTNHFNLKLWVCVSDEFDLKTIIQKIIESATGENPRSTLQMDTLQKKLKSQIDGKKYLLILDDVWNEKKEEWLKLKTLLVGGAKGSRILITTRGEQVAKTFDTTLPYSLRKLDECNSWLLFKKMTGLEGQEEELKNSNLVQIGKEVVARLKGVPLVIRTIGGLLKDKKSKRFWLSFKDKELYQVMGQKNLEDIRPILELSYKHLPSNLKQCFLYCALFPKDYKIKKDDLILHWRAQGFIQPYGNDNLIDIGDDYFMELLSRSFFQEVRKDECGDIKAYKMHDLMHDLACVITNNNECVHGLIGNVIDKRTHHFSWEACEELPKTLSKAANSRTFFMRDSVDRLELDYDKFFRDDWPLRTLHLEWLNNGLDQNVDLLECIGKFKHLRYLKICGLGFEDLPNSITKLYNLETLILPFWLKLKKLSSDIENLINLKHLDLSNNLNLEFLPDSITELCKLEVLILENCVNLKGLPGDIKNWTNLRQLDLSFNRNIEFLPDSITQLNNLETLILYACDKLKELPEDTKKLINLKHLDVNFCRSLTHMPKGLGELTNLQTLGRFVLGKNNNGGELKELEGLNKLRGTLRIQNLEFCTTVDVDLQRKAKLLQLKSDLKKLELKWSNSWDRKDLPSAIGDLDDVIYERVLDCLQPHSNLQKICIEGYKGVKLCNWVSSNSLKCMVTIQLIDCQRLQHLPRLDQFPYLKRLYLLDLPNIEYIGNHDDSVSSSTFFPCLVILRIASMPKLKRWWKGTTSTESPILFPRLSNLGISGCHLHILMSWHAPNLKSLEIGDSDDGQHPIELDEFDVVPWKNFENLSSLQISHICKLEYLPECLQQYMTALQHLSLLRCYNLKSLPEWIDKLTSLIELFIYNCEKLTLLLKEIRHINGLKRLRIEGCPILKERCKEDTGEDWPKVAHIPCRVIRG